MNKLIVYLCILTILLIGCTKSECFFSSPTEYYAEALLEVYTEKFEFDYDIKIFYDNNKYKIIIQNSENNQWCVVHDGVHCLLKNNEFKDDDILIENIYLNQLVNDLDLSKFNGMNNDNAEYFINNYKYVLHYNVDNKYPESISIYFNDVIEKKVDFKIFQIENIDTENFNILDNIIVE